MLLWITNLGMGGGGGDAVEILTPCVSAAALYQPGAIGLVNQPGARESTAYLPGTNSEMGC